MLKVLFQPFISLVSNFIARLPESSFKEEIRKVFYQEIISERIVEYPLVFMNLPKTKGKVLDVGCRYSNLILQLASLGYQSYGIDLKPYPYTHPNLKIITGDIRKTNFPPNFFDCVTAISTVEHIGLGFYENTPPDPLGDSKSIKEIYRILKPRGRLIYTSPFGKSSTSSTYRVYSQSDLDHMFKKFSRKSFTYFCRSHHCWIPCALREASGVDSSSRVDCMVLAVCDK